LASQIDGVQSFGAAVCVALREELTVG